MKNQERIAVYAISMSPERRIYGIGHIYPNQGIFHRSAFWSIYELAKGICEEKGNKNIENKLILVTNEIPGERKHDSDSNLLNKKEWNELNNLIK